METLTAKILDYLKGQSFQVAVVFVAVLILTYLLKRFLPLRQRRVRTLNISQCRQIISKPKIQ